jgi:YceI-like domain
VKIALFIVFVSTSISVAQSRFEITSGNIDFLSNAPLELINASSEKIMGILDASDRQFAVIVNTGSFKGFNSELQRQHFNEKYMETDKYYQSTFSGSIQDSINLYIDGVYKVKVKGTLLIHGKKQPRTIPVTIISAKGMLTVQSDFKVKLADHGIAIPKIVDQKIATEVLVKLQFLMAEKKVVRN